MPNPLPSQTLAPFEKDYSAYDEFHEAWTSSDFSPEKKLQLAVLEDAWQVLSDKKLSRRRDFVETLEWLCQPGSEHPFTLAAICQSLGFSYSRIRQRFEQVARSGDWEMYVPVGKRRIA